MYDWYFFDGDTKIPPSNFENLPQKLFCFFFQPKIEFDTQTNIFLKLFFLQGYDNVGFFPFHLNFFSKRLKISFVWRVYVCLDQCLII